MAKPAGNLFRVAGLVALLTLGLLWALDALLPTTYPPDPCGNLPEGVSCAPPDIERGPVDDLQLFLLTIGVELSVVAGYLVVAVIRGRLAPRAVLRWAPTAVAVVGLAVGGFGWAFSGGDLSDPGSIGIGYLVLFVCWLLTPLVLYDVYRGDRAAVVLVALGLAPTAAAGALFLADPLITALPTAMLVIAIVTVVVVHRRRRR